MKEEIQFKVGRWTTDPRSMTVDERSKWQQHFHRGRGAGRRI